MIWKRYFYKEIFKTFCFLLFGFFVLYVTIDVMAHLKDIKAGKTSFYVWFLYYLCTFSRRLDVLLPFAVLIGTIRILLSLQAKNELVALLVSGVPMRTLLKPFLVSACVASLILYANFEFFLPKAQPQALAIQENDFGKKMAIIEQEAEVREVLLKDTSRMYYRSYNSQLKEFSDVFWVVNIDKVYHMNTLSCRQANPVGSKVDLVEREESGKMVKKASYDTLEFTHMQFDEESLKDSIQPPKDQSISTLISQARLYGASTSDRAIDIRSFLLYKLTFPLLCILAVMAPAAYCLTFRRNMAHFMIYLLSLGGLFCFFLLLQVALVLAKSHVISPAVAFGVPWVVAFLLIGKNFMKVLRGKT